MNNLSELIYEPVTAEYGWGKYGDFKVLIRKKDGYINATKLCRDGGKELKNWLPNDSSKKIVEELERAAGISATQLLETINCGSNYQISGTYAHSLLIPSIAMWTSPKFGIMASKLINEYLVKQYREEIYQRDLELGRRKEKIDELMDEVIRTIWGRAQSNYVSRIDFE